MKQLIFILSLATCVFCFSECKKNQLGGKSSIKGTVAHHGKPIANAIVYIKFNAKEFPGENTAVYNASVTANASGYYESPKLYKGDYYLYSVGMDPAIAAPYIVKGGFAVSLKSDEEKNIDIAVTEGD
ncbi:MAG: carboxypeptidase-like regulatory domain-containing protein [Bacteroidia bacterium]